MLANRANAGSLSARSYPESSTWSLQPPWAGLGLLCLLPISRAHSVLWVPPPTPVSSTTLPWMGPSFTLFHPSHSATEQVSTEYHS